MKIVSLNIRHGGGSRLVEIGRYLVRQRADVIVVTEFRENANARLLQKILADEGFEFFAAASKNARDNTVAIFSRLAFEPTTYPELGQHAHRVLSANFAGLRLYGVYFPQKLAKKEVFDFLLGGAPSNATGPLLAIGDFNTGLHHLDETGATFHCTAEFRKLSAAYIDCWRSRYPDARQFTWKSAAGNGFRIDHAFGNAAADRRITSVFYDHSPRETGVTDHSALIIDMDDQAAA